ncbi:hypothetical protein KQL69_004533 [Escherichia coli]|nr:hypothetical protein [Escherichia coli]EHP9646283.1 hypothetical protein [Escherichia coli]EHP9686435.1 hypothetical protein [Escherichia coli]EHP9691856.1 hypothetical protein [Escherichia coli]EHP9721325.1 hypothetical protein [Escherichia coli]
MSPFLRGSIGPVQNDKGEEPPSNLARHVAKIDHRVSVSFLRKMRSFLRTFPGGFPPASRVITGFVPLVSMIDFVIGFVSDLRTFLRSFSGGCHDSLKLSCLPEAAIQPLYWSAGEKSVYCRLCECICKV